MALDPEGELPPLYKRKKPRLREVGHLPKVAVFSYLEGGGFTRDRTPRWARLLHGCFPPGLCSYWPGGCQGPGTFHPGLPAPQPDGAQTDSQVWAPLPSPSWAEAVDPAGPERGRGVGEILKTSPSPHPDVLGGWETTQCAGRKVLPDRFLFSSWDQPRELSLLGGFLNAGLIRISL